MKLIKLYTVTSGHYIDEAKWNDPTKEVLAAYNKSGERIHDLCTPYYIRKRAENCMYGFIHRENLSPTKSAAKEKREQIYKELFSTP